MFNFTGAVLVLRFSIKRTAAGAGVKVYVECFFNGEAIRVKGCFAAGCVFWALKRRCLSIALIFE